MISKPSFLLYKDSFEFLKDLSDKDFGRLFKSVFIYSISGDLLPKNDPLYLAFMPIKLSIDRDNIKYLKRSEVNSVNGSKGGKQKLANATNRKRLRTKVADRDIVIDTDIVIETEKEIVSRLLPSHMAAFFSWLEYRKSIKKKIDNPTTLKSLVEKFNSEPLAKVVWVVDQSIQNSWQGLFWDKYETPVKKEKSKYELRHANEKW